MTALDQQLGVKDESAYGTAVTVDKFFEFESEGIELAWGRTEGDPLRPGTFFKRSDRHVPYQSGAAGAIELAVMDKGFGWWLKHMLGAVSTGSATDSLYGHTGTPATLVGDSFTAQITRPFHPTGTAQAFTFAGGKVASWALNNTVDGHLLATMNVDFQKWVTGTALATASYPSSARPLSWTMGSITLGGSAVPVTEISIEVDNGLDVERRKIQGSALKDEPTGEGRSGTFSLTADFSSLSLHDLVNDTDPDDNIAELVATWTGTATVGTSSNPSLVVTAQVRLNELSFPNNGRGVGIMQTLSGDIVFDGTDSIEVVYSSSDATP